MALLKKIYSATLIEALVATVLIVIIFMVASLILNNLLLNSFSNNTHAVENRIYELEYHYAYGTITIPYKEDMGKWRIELNTEDSEGKMWLTGKATNTSNSKEIIKSRLCSTAK